MMNDTHPPRFSVIIPAHNAAGTLRECLSSLAAQVLPCVDFEVILVDDRSTDGTWALAHASVDRYVYGRFTSVAAVRNAGAAVARGALLAFLDADVEADARWLSRAVRYFDEGFIGVLGFADKPPANAHWVGRTWNNPRRQQYNVLQEFDFLPSRNLIVPAELHRKLGGFDEALFAGGRAGEDKAYCYRFRAAGYRVLCDPGLAMIHLGYERSLAELVRKEWWRQGHTLAIARAFGYPRRLLKNPFMSIVHLLGLGTSLVATVGRCPALRPLAALVWALPSMLLVLRRTDLRGDKRILPAAWFLTWLRWNVAGVALVRQLAIRLRPRRAGSEGR